MKRNWLLGMLPLLALPLMYSCSSDDDAAEVVIEEDTRGDTYRWRGNEKQPLWYVADKSYVMFRAADQETVLAKLAAMGAEVDEGMVQELNMIDEHFVIRTEAFYEMADYRHILEVNADFRRIYEIPEVTYAGPYLTADEHDLREQFPMNSFVFLHSSNLPQLEEAAQEFGFKILGKFSLWGRVLWVGTCDRTSKGNSLEIFNILVERHIIDSEATVPDAHPD